MSSISSIEKRWRLATAATAKRATATHSARAGIESLHRTLLVVEDPEDLDQAGDVENLLDLRVRADEIHRTAVLAHALESADEHAQTGRVNVADVLKVDDQVIVLLIDQLTDRIFHFGRGVHVDLAGEVNNVRVAFRLAYVHFDIHVSPS
jgi:hypothetical protein